MVRFKKIKGKLYYDYKKYRFVSKTNVKRIKSLRVYYKDVIIIRKIHKTSYQKAVKIKKEISKRERLIKRDIKRKFGMYRCCVLAMQKYSKYVMVFYSKIKARFKSDVVPSWRKSHRGEFFVINIIISDRNNVLIASQLKTSIDLLYSVSELLKDESIDNLYSAVYDNVKKVKDKNYLLKYLQNAIRNYDIAIEGGTE